MESLRCVCKDLRWLCCLSGGDLVLCLVTDRMDNIECYCCCCRAECFEFEFWDRQGVGYWLPAYTYYRISTTPITESCVDVVVRTCGADALISASQSCDLWHIQKRDSSRACDSSHSFMCGRHRPNQRPTQTYTRWEYGSWYIREDGAGLDWTGLALCELCKRLIQVCYMGELLRLHRVSRQQAHHKLMSCPLFLSHGLPPHILLAGASQPTSSAAHHHWINLIDELK